MRLILICVFIIFPIINPVFGQTIETDRPDQTESSSSIPNNSLQIESGVLHGYTENDDNLEQETLLPTTLFRLGITRTIELRILSQFESLQYSHGRINGISDLEIGTKIQLFKKENSRTEMAFISHLVLPTGSSGLTNSKYGSISKLSISHVLSENLGLGYNIGYNYFGTGNGDLTYSLAFGYSLNDKLGVYLEPYGQITEFDNWVSNADAGFTYLLRDNLQFDFSFGTGINHRMNYLSIGMSWISKPRK